MWELKTLMEHSNSCLANINGRWIPIRPTKSRIIGRIKDAYLVLSRKADAFKWPENQ